MNKDTEAIESLIWFKSIASDACDGLGLSLEIENNFKKVEKALEAQSKAVDVEGVFFEISDNIKKTHGMDEALRAQPLIGLVLNYLNNQGHLTSSEKPTHSIQAAKGDGE